MEFECAICLGQLGKPVDTESPEPETLDDAARSAKSDIMSTLCGHLYHRYCLENALAKTGARECPTCRKDVPVSAIIKLYPNEVLDTSSVSNKTVECLKAQCKLDRTIHLTLVDDFEKIRKEYADLRESNNIKDAQIESLMSALNRKSEPTPSSSKRACCCAKKPAAKQRRQR